MYFRIGRSEAFAANPFVTLSAARYKEAAQAAHESGKRVKALALAARGRRASGGAAGAAGLNRTDRDRGERPGAERPGAERSKGERPGEGSGARGTTTSHLSTQPFVPQREVD